MNIPATPSEMQAFIVEQLLHDGSALDELVDSKTQIKFFKLFGKEIEACLRDKIFHELQINYGSPKEDGFQNFMESDTTSSPTSLLKLADGQVIAIVRCNNVMRALLSRLFFGGDVGNPLRPSDKQVTKIEIGLQDIFSGFLSQSLSKTAQLDSTTTATFSAEEFDPDEVADENAITCRYEIQAGPLKCNLEIAVLDTIVERVLNESETGTDTSISTPNYELIQGKISASIKLKPISASLKSIQELKVGDRLSLGSGGNLKGIFEVNGQSVYDCDIGRAGETYCLKISDRSNPHSTVSQTQSTVG